MSWIGAIKRGIYYRETCKNTTVKIKKVSHDFLHTVL